MEWGKLEVYGMEEAELKALTTTITMDATIPTIWSPRLEKNYRRLVKMPQFAVRNTELLGREGDTVKISKMNDIGPAEDMEKTGPAGQAPRGAETPWDNTTKGVHTAFRTTNIVELIPTMKFKAVKFTKKELNRSFVGRMNDATEGIGYSFALKMDMDCFGSIAGATKVVGVTDWTAALITDIFDTAKVKDAKLKYDVAVEMNDFAYFERETIVCLIHPYQGYHLTQDVDWFDVVKRNSAEAIFRGELVEWDGVRFVTSTGVPYYAGGVITDIAVQDMVPQSGAVPDDTWLLSTTGALPGWTGFISPLYQTALSGNTDLLVTVAPVDAGAKITFVDHHNGIVKFDVEIGAPTAPTAEFSHGTVHGYQSPLIGPRAFVIADKEYPQLRQEITNYGLFVGVGGVADYDVKLLNDEQIVLLNTAVNPPA